MQGSRASRRLVDLLIAALGLAGAIAVPGPAAAAPRVEFPGAGQATHTDRAVVETTLALLGFGRWPGDPVLLRLCLVGTSGRADMLLSARHRPMAGRRVSVRQRAPVDVGTDCDAVFLGRLPQEQLQAVYARMAGRPELSIGERPEDCRAGAAFCLDECTPGIAFGVNLVSLARSGVRMHPGVLQLARRRGRAQ